MPTSSYSLQWVKFRIRQWREGGKEKGKEVEVVKFWSENMKYGICFDSCFIWSKTH